MWVSVIPDADLDSYLQQKSRNEFLVFSVLGSCCTTGPWANEWRGSRVSLAHLFNCWSDTQQLNLQSLQRSLSKEEWTWEHLHSALVFTEGARKASSADLVTASWLARGCGNWRLWQWGPPVIKVLKTDDCDAIA